MKNLRERLDREEVVYSSTDRKPTLVQLLFDKLSETVNIGEPKLSETVNVEKYAPRSRYAYSHKQRMLTNKRTRQDAETARQERQEERQRTTTQQVTNSQSSVEQKRTATQVVNEFALHAKALHTLATKGDRRDDRQHEREGYNLLVLRQSQMGDGSHVWKAGDSDMSRLPSHVSSVYDTAGWVCVNTFADNDRVVFKRPAPPLPVRGSGAQLRKVDNTNTRTNRTLTLTLNLSTCDAAQV